MNGADRIYRVLLRAYPASFRAAFGSDMVQLFRDRQRALTHRPLRLWSEILWDVARSAPAQRLERSRAWWDNGGSLTEAMMMIMAILAILVGAIEALNASIEVRYGLSSAGGNASLFAGSLGMLAGVLLLAAGIAMLRRTSHSLAHAQRAAIVCLAVFALVLVVQPIFSIFASLLGIGFPIAMLVYVWRAKSGGMPNTMRA